jgi:beta-galactosidase
VLTNFDIFATAGGEYKAVVEQFTEVAPTNGTFTIQFSTVKDNAQINGIEILSG